MLPILNTVSTETFSAPPALAFTPVPVKSKEKIASVCAVLVMDIETEEIFGVKFPKELWPCCRNNLRVDESCEFVARNPKCVLRCRGCGKRGPSKREGFPEAYTAMAFANRTKVYITYEAFMTIVAKVLIR
jgi:hypothetical protein